MVTLKASEKIGAGKTVSTPERNFEGNSVPLDKILIYFMIFLKLFQFWFCLYIGVSNTESA